MMTHASTITTYALECNLLGRKRREVPLLCVLHACIACVLNAANVFTKLSCGTGFHKPYREKGIFTFIGLDASSSLRLQSALVDPLKYALGLQMGVYAA